MNLNTSSFTRLESPISKMNNTIIGGDDTGDTIYGVSAVYLVIVAISGGACNIMALLRAIRVSLRDEDMKMRSWIL